MAEYFDIEKLIELVRQQPELWDQSHDSYNDKKEKSKVWINVCYNFCDKYESLSPAAQVEFRQKVISKWRNVRDNFIKCIKRKSTNRPYCYAKQLSFLVATPNSNLDEECNDGESSYLDEDDGPDEVIPAKKCRKFEQPDEPTYIDSNLEDDAIEAFIEKNSLENKIGKFLESRMETTALSYFFHSLSSVLNSFSEDEQLEFQSDVLNIIRKIKYKRSKLVPCKCKTSINST